MSIEVTKQINPMVIEAAQKTAVYTDRSDLGTLKITGATRLDLLNRMSTQKLVDLPSGSGAATVLTTDIGRIIDRLLLYASSDTVYALTGENNAEAIARYLMRFVFFNDDFHIQDISPETAVFGIYGPQAAHILGEELGFPEVDIPLHHWREAEIGGTTAYLHHTDPINGAGYFVMCETVVRDTLAQQLQASSLTHADQAAFDYLRITAGLPRFGHELTQEYIPLEANLWDDVSFNKGCYIGQEIIARMESRGKLAKQLTKLRLSAPVDAEATLTAAGKKAGTLTSVAVGPEDVVGLGYVKTAVLDASTELYAGDVLVRSVHLLSS